MLDKVKDKINLITAENYECKDCMSNDMINSA